MRSAILVILSLVFSISGKVASQNTDAAQPLGDVAKKNDTAKKENAGTKAKRVFTDDDMSVRKSPIPSIALQGADNTEEVVASIHDFRAKHNAEDTENTLHEWFDAQAEVLTAAIDANVRMQKHNQMRWESVQDRGPYIYDGDNAKLNERQITERFFSTGRCPQLAGQLPSHLQIAAGTYEGSSRSVLPPKQDPNCRL